MRENRRVKPEIKDVIRKKRININREAKIDEDEIAETLKAVKKINNFRKNNFNSEKNIFHQKTLPLNNLISIKEKSPNIKSKIISILGPNGIGKSVFSILLAQSMEEKKSIIIDFDVLNNSLHTLLGIKNYDEKIKKGISNNDLIYHVQDINK